jgi:hypothetical protein
MHEGNNNYTKELCLEIKGRVLIEDPDIRLDVYNTKMVL